MHPLKIEEYQSMFLATINFSCGQIDILGGKSDKISLKKAKRESNFCFVKDISTGRGVKLVLVDGSWIVEDSPEKIIKL